MPRTKATKTTKGHPGKSAQKLGATDPIASILDSIATLKRVSPEKPELHEVGPRWSEAEIAEFEVANRVVLPHDFRRYLLEVGDGGAGFLWHDDGCGGLHALRDIEPKERARLTKKFPLTAKSRKFPPPFQGLFKLGATSDHAQCFLVVTGKAAGQIWVDGTPYEGGYMAPEKGGLVAKQAAWLSERAAQEVDLKSPPDAARFRTMSVLDKVRYLRTPKNTVLLLDPTLLKAAEPALGKPGGAAWVRKEGGSDTDALDGIIRAAVKRGIAGPEPDLAILRMAVSLNERLVDLERGSKSFTSTEWRTFHISHSLCERALILAHAGDWKACLSVTDQALAMSDQAGPVDAHALHHLIASICLGRESKARFVHGQYPDSDWIFRSVRHLFPRLPAEARSRLLREVPPLMLVKIVLYGFRHGDEATDDRRESMALLRRSFGSVVRPLRDLVVRAVDEARAKVANIARPIWRREMPLAEEVAHIDGFFEKAGFDELPPAERDPKAARELAANAALIAAATSQGRVETDLRARARALGANLDAIERDSLFVKFRKNAPGALTVYATATCAASKKACAWLEEQWLPYRWVDLAEERPPRERITEWIDAFGPTGMVDARDFAKERLDRASLIKALTKDPKRTIHPVIEENGKPILIGFDVERYAQALT